MKKFEVSNINLIIDCFNDLPSNISDYLAFLSYFSFYEQFKDSLKPLIVVPVTKNTAINYWALRFKIPLVRKQINFENIIQRPAFRVKCGLIMLDQNFDYQYSFDEFENYGMSVYSGEKINFKNIGMIGKLDDDFSSSFINLNQNIYFKNLVNILYGVPKDTLKIDGTTNKIVFSKILTRAYKIFTNFPEIR